MRWGNARKSSSMIAGQMKERNGVELTESIEFGNVTLRGIFRLPKRRALFSLLTRTAVAAIARAFIVPPEEEDVDHRMSQLRLNLDKEICHAF